MIIVILLCIVSVISPSCKATAINDSSLVYREIIDDQDLSSDGELIQMHRQYPNEMVDVKRLTRQFIGDMNEKGFNRPLSVGMKWDQDKWRKDNMYCYYVEKREDVTVPAGTFKACFKIVYVTMPDDQAWWYYPGLGVVKYEYKHHGPVEDIMRELISK